MRSDSGIDPGKFAAPLKTVDAVASTAESVYTNPLRYDDGKIHTAPDPFVLEYRGTYFCYATGEKGVVASYSQDLVHWHYAGVIYSEPAKKNFWAPSVILLNGVFYMYVSDMPEDTDDTHREIMRVVTSESPLGPFTYAGTLFGTFAIDSQIFLDENGELWLFYADNQGTGLSASRPGTAVVVDRMVNPLEREGHPRVIIQPTSDHEIFQRDRFEKGKDWHTVEGATFIRHHGKGFITYSGNAFEHEDYFIGYSSANIPEGQATGESDPRCWKWRKHHDYGRFDPLMRKSGEVEGTGHNSIVKAPNQIDDWIVYHGRNVDEPSVLAGLPEQRTMRIDPLFFVNEGMETTGPTLSSEHAPARPDFFDFPDTDFVVSQNMEHSRVPTSNIAWRIDGNALRRSAGELSYGENQTGQALVPDDSVSCSVLSVWVRIPVSPLGSDCGLVLRGDTHKDGGELCLHVNGGTHSVWLSTNLSGVIKTEVAHCEALKSIDFSQWHHFIAVVTYETCRVEIDGIHVLTCDIPQGSGPLGLFSHHSAVDFSAFALTRHYDLWGSSLNELQGRVSSQGTVVIDHNSARPESSSGATLTLPLLADCVSIQVDLALHAESGVVVLSIGDVTVNITAQDVSVAQDSDTIIPQKTQRAQLPSDSQWVPPVDCDGNYLQSARLRYSAEDLEIFAARRLWSVNSVRASPTAGNRSLQLVLRGASILGVQQTSHHSSLTGRRVDPE